MSDAGGCQQAATQPARPQPHPPHVAVAGQAARRGAHAPIVVPAGLARGGRRAGETAAEKQARRDGLDAALAWQHASAPHTRKRIRKPFNTASTLTQCTRTAATNAFAAYIWNRGCSRSRLLRIACAQCAMFFTDVPAAGVRGGPDGGWQTSDGAAMTFTEVPAAGACKAGETWCLAAATTKPAAWHGHASVQPDHKPAWQASQRAACLAGVCACLPEGANWATSSSRLTFMLSAGAGDAMQLHVPQQHASQPCPYPKRPATPTPSGPPPQPQPARHLPPTYIEPRHLTPTSPPPHAHLY